jgi:uncharacterized membrane protein YwzB
MDEVISFDLSLKGSHREDFLIMVCVVCWSLWMLRNKIIFQNAGSITNRNLILFICALLDYWSGNFKEDVKKKLRL